MGTRDMAEVVETFRRKFMEGAAGTAGRVADACAWLVANPGGMAPHDMELEPARLVGGVPDSLSAAAVTAAAALDDSGMAAASRPEPVANGRRATSVQFLHGHSISLKCRHFAVRRRRRSGKGRSRRWSGECPAPDRLGIVADASPALCGAVTRACLSETCDSAVRTLACRGTGMSVTRAQRISRAIGSRSLELRDRRLAGAVTAAGAQRAPREAREDAVPASAGLWGDLGGTDIAVAIDGGRMNIRTARPGRVAADRSRHGHRTDWREPRLHIIHEVGKGGACRGADGSRRAAPRARRTGWPPCRRRTSGASGPPRPGGSRSPATAPSGSGGGWTPSRRPPGSRRGNARAAWTSTMRSGILRCSPSTRGSGTRASVCGGRTA